LAWFVHLGELKDSELKDSELQESKEVRSTMISGKVKWFNAAKGYGFIQLAQGSDVFVHYSVIETDGYRSLREGQEVTFELGCGPKGDHATKVVTAAALETIQAEPACAC